VSRLRADALRRATVSARSIALRLLSRRDYTTRELRQKLLDRDLPEAEVDDTLRALAASQLLDDRRAGAAHVRMASQIKGRGRLRIQRELEARGLDRPLIRELLADLDPTDDLAAITRFLKRKRLPAKPTPAERRRVFQQLLRRGFTAEAIAKAIGRQDEDE
jgi:regulatory protein